VLLGSVLRLGGGIGDWEFCCPVAALESLRFALNQDFSKILVVLGFEIQGGGGGGEFGTPIRLMAQNY
jgi:hypothetical protein